ncbi:hypothetical protein COO60DRAFT_412318 [Scenedesmus sp. NREL 46B-D3]|nr:hypothetical protein COO60DRAFT_412318 [Scenedesmus sp. NREL 46B-D3]
MWMSALWYTQVNCSVVFITSLICVAAQCSRQCVYGCHMHFVQSKGAVDRATVPKHSPAVEVAAVWVVNISRRSCCSSLILPSVWCVLPLKESQRRSVLSAADGAAACLQTLYISPCLETVCWWELLGVRCVARVLWCFERNACSTSLSSRPVAS